MASPTYRFGDFLLDPANRELRRGDEEVPLQRKAFDCLVYLIEHRDRVVASDELFAAVWGDVQLSESVLRQAVLAVRRALGDAGRDQEIVKTVWGVGYRWVAPVETVKRPAEAGGARRRPWMPMSLLLGVLAAGALTVGALYLRRDADRRGAAGATAALAEGDIALVLPVTAEVEESHSWLRLGLMDLIASRLRAAGQTMVPSDTVIALLRDHAAKPDPDEIAELAVATGAHLVLAAQAELAGGLWRVSLRSVRGPDPPLSALGEAEDAVDAARIAADRLALSLGRTPAPDPDAGSGLTALMQQIEAAWLAQRTDVARELIEGADAELRRHPEIRLQEALLDFHRRDYEASQRAYEALLEDLPDGEHSLLRARILSHLGSMHFRQGSHEADAIWERALRLLERRGQAEAHTEQGRLHVLLGTAVAVDRGVDAARDHLARGRVLLEGTGDLRGLAWLDNNLGALESERQRYTEALRYFERAAERFQKLNVINGELRARANGVRSHLRLLDPPAAMAIEPRLEELLERTGDPEVATHVRLVLAELQSTTGRVEEARASLAAVLRVAESRADLYDRRIQALTLLAEHALRRGAAAEAARHAAEVVDYVPTRNAILVPQQQAYAHLMLVRAHLALGDSAAAFAASAALAAKADGADIPAGTGVYAALAQAEVDAALGRASSASAAFERALELAEASRAPQLLLRVCDAYVAWLLDAGPAGAGDPERALLVAGHLDRHTDRHYDAALVQLRAHQAAGYPSAWRTALDRAQSLAGERQIPPALLVAPRPRAIAAAE